MIRSVSKNHAKGDKVKVSGFINVQQQQQQELSPKTSEDQSIQLTNKKMHSFLQTSINAQEVISSFTKSEQNYQLLQSNEVFDSPGVQFKNKKMRTFLLRSVINKQDMIERCDFEHAITHFIGRSIGSSISIPCITGQIFNLIGAQQLRLQMSQTSTLSGARVADTGNKDEFENRNRDKIEDEDNGNKDRDEYITQSREENSKRKPSLILPKPNKSMRNIVEQNYPERVGNILSPTIHKLNKEQERKMIPSSKREMMQSKFDYICDILSKMCISGSEKATEKAACTYDKGYHEHQHKQIPQQLQSTDSTTVLVGSYHNSTQGIGLKSGRLRNIANEQKIEQTQSDLLSITTLASESKKKRGLRNSKNNIEKILHFSERCCDEQQYKREQHDAVSTTTITDTRKTDALKATATEGTAKTEWCGCLYGFKDIKGKIDSCLSDEKFKMKQDCSQLEFQNEHNYQQNEYYQQIKSPYSEPYPLRQRILNIIEVTKKDSIDSFNIDLLIDSFKFEHFAERMVGKQQEFNNANVPSYIDVGYHFTDPQNLQNISMHSLLTQKERSEKYISSVKKRGSAFGDGIYTCNNPLTFKRVGNSGLLVARLKGSATRVAHSFNPNWDQLPKNTNTIIGDKIIKGTPLDSEGWPKTDYFHEIVLLSSSQCLPLVQFDSYMLKSKEGAKHLYNLQVSIQKILDELLNRECERPSMKEIVRGSPMFRPKKTVGISPSFPLPVSFVGNFKKHNISAGSSNFNKKIECELFYDAPNNISSTISQKLSCSLATASITARTNLQQINPLNMCQSKFDKCNKHISPNQNNACCDEAARGESRGMSPSGTMKVIIITNKLCEGYENCSASFQIKYSMMGFKTSPRKNSQNEAKVYNTGKEATAFLPKTMDGQDLLKRLKYAFLHGLTFTSKISLNQTSTAEIQCTWASIPHKTQLLGGGVDGYPDPNYIRECNLVLDGLNVPPSQGLQDNGTEGK